MTQAHTLKALAFYLPQFHPIPENDAWWGKGFTEWTNVAKARPQFRGHYQPHLPSDTGFYDLRLPEARQLQADLARDYGITGFCYYHYWFNGRRLLERPFNDVLASGQPDLPFCLCWANEDWTRAWDGRSGEYLLQQHYSETDDQAHCQALAPAFADPRYIRIDGKPLFLMYRASRMPDPLRATTTWRETAQRLGIGELFLARVESFASEQVTAPQTLGFDAAVEFQPDWRLLGKPLHRDIVRRALWKLGINRSGYQRHNVYDYATMMQTMLSKPDVDYLRFPCVTPSWDNTARRANDAGIVHGSTPELYEQWLTTIVQRVKQRPANQQVLFINAWNEWAEGNHLEPDQRWGRAYLEATKRALQ
ncbi:MAG: glycoside hydrolase family 99-like domain-containing protein [Herpetosiphon sp.]|nr:glycoside hydrolase family 99-like domain-containing protein [Herpetosiphon sp.]